MNTLRVQPRISPFNDPTEQIRKLDHFGCLARVIEPSGAVAGPA